MAAFRRTNYQNNTIRGVKLKQTSRSNLSRDGSSLSGHRKMEKSRTNSNYLTEKPPIYGSNVPSNVPVSS